MLSTVCVKLTVGLVQT